MHYRRLMANSIPRAFLDTTPARFRHWSVAALAAWSVVIWLTRLRNVFNDDALSSGARAAWLVPVVLFILGGLVCGLAWWKGRGELPRPIALFCLISSLYWLVRVVFVLIDHRSVGFVLVHLVLAAVSVALAALVMKLLWRTGVIPTGAYR